MINFIMISTAEKVLISRATQCSFSSVFHLSKAGMSKADFNTVKRLFQLTIIAPIVSSVTVVSSYYYFIKK